MQSSFDNLSGFATIELEALLRDYLLGLVLIAGGGGDAPNRPVQWVHVSDLIDPTPFLTPRTVLLTTGVQFGEHLETDEAESYVGRLSGAGTTALGVAVGVQWDRIPPSLIDACERNQLPLFRVPYDTPFIAVVRTAARLIEAATHASGLWDREGAGSITSIGSRRNLVQAEQAVRTAVLGLLLGGQRDLAEQVAKPLLPRLPRGQVAVVSVPTPLPAKVLAELTPLAAEQAGVLSAMHSLGGGERFVVVAEPAGLSPLRHLLTKHAIAAGISERDAVAELPELLQQAERAAELAGMQTPAAPLVYRPEMHAGVLQLLLGRPEAVRRAQGLLGPLRRHDTRHDDSLELSLITWLRHHGQTSPAAAELGVHRHTLRSRVQMAAELLQRDLDDPGTRAELWAALELAPPQSPPD